MGIMLEPVTDADKFTLKERKVYENGSRKTKKRAGTLQTN